MYNKPLILTNDDMAEGVYAASGDPASAGSDFSYTLIVRESSIGEYYSRVSYGLTLTNNGSEAVPSITVTLSVTGDQVSGVFIDASAPSGSVSWNGSTAAFTFDNWGAGFQPGGSGEVGVAVSGKGQIGLA